MPHKRLGDIAHARSGDKGNTSNLGVIARNPSFYGPMCRALSADVVRAFFMPMGVSRVDRYELPNLHALNFILHNALDGGGSRSLRIDAQGKAFAQLLLELQVHIPET